MALHLAQVFWAQILQGYWKVTHRPTMRWWLISVVLMARGDGWWFGNDTQTPPKVSERWRQFRDTFPATEAMIDRWHQWGVGHYADWSTLFDGAALPAFDFNLWLLVDSLFGFLGWAVFGSAWGGVKTGCKRLVQIGAVLVVCLIAHYLWSVCYPIVSIILACLMAVVWILRKVLRLIGTLFFHVQRLSGGAPEAADTEFHGPGTGTVPETSVLRGFKRSGDNPKQVVVRRGDEVAVFAVGSEQQNIRTHGLYLPVEPDTVRGTPNLVRQLRNADRVHLCRNLVCTEDSGEHFTEYGVVKKFNGERFQIALTVSKQFWSWFAPASQRTVSDVVSRIREYASESETEDLTCCAGQVTWMTDDGLKSLSESRCSQVGTLFHQAIEGDFPLACTRSLCPKHATLYFSKRYEYKCGFIGCQKYGDKLHSGVRWCADHVPGRDTSEATAERRSRTRSRPRSRSEPEEGDAEDEVEDPDPENGEARARSLMRGGLEAADPQRRARRRPTNRSPGSTPKSNIQRNLARIEMLSSPGSEVEPRLLEAFLEKFAEGKAEGLREDQIRSIIARERVMTDVEVLRRLIEEVQVEREKGQKGLSRFLNRWTRELAEKERPSPDSDWSMLTAIQGNPRRDRPPQGGPSPSAGAGGAEMEKPSIKALWGPKLTTEEVNRAKERAPLDRQGNLLCWGNLCHVGCSVSGCQRSHEALRGSFESLDPAVQLQFLKRGGLKRMKAETKESVNLKIKDIRTKMEKDRADKVQDGKKRAAGSNQAAKDEAVESSKPSVEEQGGGKAGSGGKNVRFWEPPEEFKLDYTAQEDVKQLVDGPQKDWGKSALSPGREHSGRGGESAPAQAHQLVKEAQRLSKSTVLQKLEEASDDLYAWAAARVAREPEVEFKVLMTEMATYGLGELANEAANFLEHEGGVRAGSSRLQVHPVQWSGGGPGQGFVDVDGQKWKFLDYKEEVYMSEELAGLLGLPEPAKEKRQCVTLSLAAGIFHRLQGRWPSMAEAQQQAQALRVEQARLATEARTIMGDAEEMVSPVEHEARVYVHDIITAHHEKDFRSLAMFPVQDLVDARLVVLRADYKGGLLVESVLGAQWGPECWTLPVLIWKGHMVVLEPPADFDLEAFISQEESSSTPSLGFSFFWHSRHDQARTAPGRLHCRLCKADRKAGDFFATCRPHSCLAALATMAAGEGRSEVVRSVPLSKANQEHDLVLQEVFAGTGRITTAWTRGGAALPPIEVFARPHLKEGYRREHDLLLPEVQHRVLLQCDEGDANVWWIAAPCTSYCDWQLQNGGTRTFDNPEGTGQGPHAQREADGNCLSTFGATLFEKALDKGQFPVCESSAASGRYPKQWDLPIWRRILQRDDVDYIDFPMCAWGLGPPDAPDSFYVHKTRLVFPRHEPLRRILVRPCPGVGPRHKHVALKGARDGQQVTRCTEAGAYAWDFVKAVVAVLQSTLGGVRVSCPQSPGPTVRVRAGGKRGRSSGETEDDGEEFETVEEELSGEDREEGATQNSEERGGEENSNPEDDSVHEENSNLEDNLAHDENEPLENDHLADEELAQEEHEARETDTAFEDDETLENDLAPENNLVSDFEAVLGDDEMPVNDIEATDEEQSVGRSANGVTRCPSAGRNTEELDRMAEEAEMRELFGDEEVDRALGSLERKAATDGTSGGRASRSRWCSAEGEEQQRLINQVLGEQGDAAGTEQVDVESDGYEPSIAGDGPSEAEPE
eukprot:s1669_g4.t1